MTDLQPSGPNAEQIRYWNETAGPKWIAFQGFLDSQLGPLGRAAMDRARIAAGERVLDVGCGCGDTALELGRRVGPSGMVLGVDLSTGMLARATTMAAETGLEQVRFEAADAQTHRFPRGELDVVFSRFGVMFFTDPAAAFANLRGALRPGGRLAFVCWQTLFDNPWMFLPLSAAAALVPLPPPPAPDAPGPFSFADRERVGTILARAGFERVDFAELRETLTVGGGGLDQAVEFLLQMGPTGAALRDVDPAAKSRVAAAVREAIAPFHTPAGVRMASAAWIVTAAGS